MSASTLMAWTWRKLFGRPSFILIYYFEMFWTLDFSAQCSSLLINTFLSFKSQRKVKTRNLTNGWKPTVLQWQRFHWLSREQAALKVRAKWSFVEPSLSSKLRHPMNPSPHVLTNLHQSKRGIVNQKQHLQFPVPICQGHMMTPMEKLSLECPMCG